MSGEKKPIIGIIGGIGFVELITALFSSLGFELPSAGLVIGAPTIIVPLLIGLVATTVSSIVPALRATRVAPLEALREGTGARGSAARDRRRGLTDYAPRWRRARMATIFQTG